MGVPPATVRSWLTDPEDETTYRRMTRGACRPLVTMVLLNGAGLLHDKFVAAVDTFDRWLNQGDVRLGSALQAMRAIQLADGNVE